MGIFAKKLGIDLGSVNVMVYSRGQILLQEPAMVALTTDEIQPEVRALGQEARDMWGRHADDITIVQPLKDGVIADYEVTEAMLGYFMRKIHARGWFRGPDVMMSVPYGVNSVEKRAVQEAAIQAGARNVYLIHGPLAAAIGAGLPVHTPAGNMVFSLGGGVSEAAVVAMGGVVAASTIRAGGQRLDDAIINYVRRKYSLIIGEPTAEAVKIQIGAAVDQDQELSMDIQGRDQVTGLPRTITITTSEVVEAIREPLIMIANVARQTLEKTPPELASDVIDRGIVLTGGGALLRGIEEFITRHTNVPAYRASDPLVATAVGAGRALENPSLLRGIIERA
ncbi:MAG: rod shape-determining protein [Anaerolineales bacterium]|nr:rod shape-determining protein [Anaerolineales bacterium]